jgi:hypothetical protein
MHSSGRRAGYPSDSSRAERKQTRTRPAGGGQLFYDYVVDRLRHLRPRSRPQCGRAVPPGAHHPEPARAEKPSPPPPTAAERTTVAVRARCPAHDYSSPGWGTRLRHRPWPPQRAGAGGARAVARAGPRGSPYCAARCGSLGRRSGHQGDGSPDCIAIAGPGATRPDVGGGGRAEAGAALVRPPRTPYTVWGP